MIQKIGVTSTLLVLLTPALVLGQVKETRRLDACREVIEELAGIKEDGIPRDLLDKAECVAVIPGVKKAAIGFGGRFGYGAVVCRTDEGRGIWGPPLMLSLKGGSVGLQLGAQSSDLVLLIMNQKGVHSLLKSEFTLGADVSVAAGPVGRNAEAATDIQMRAEILSYSRGRGLFAGISLEGAVVKQDEGANERLYGEPVRPRELLLSGRRVPSAGRGLVNALQALSPR